MSRQKAISVKIATEKVIKALETKLVQIKKEYANQEANEAKFQKEHEKYNKTIMKYALDNVAKATNVRTNFRHWNGTLNVDFDLDVKQSDFPKQPERDFEVISHHNYREMVEEIENAIRILKMTDEEVVSTSTYNAIARYL